MNISTTGINLIKLLEGCRLVAYIDSAGVWTIGYGHTKNVKRGDTITKQKAVELLMEDLKVYEKAVNNINDTYNFNQNEFDALVSFTFNLGVGNLKRLTNNCKRSKQEIALKIPEYCNCKGKKLNGLVKRRTQELQLFLTECNKPDIEKIAQDCIKGKYGNGIDRKNVIEKLGYSYKEVQKRVNELLKVV